MSFESFGVIRSTADIGLCNMIPTRLLLLSLIVLCLSASYVTCNEPITEQCEACQAIVQQLWTHGPKHPTPTPISKSAVGNPAKKQRQAYEASLYEALDRICEQKHYQRYEFPPPKMVKACESFLEDHSDDLERLFSKGLPEKTIRQQLCVDSHICPSLWSDEEEDRKRERTPQEIASEQEKSRLARERAEKEERAKERQAKRELKRLEKEAAARGATNAATNSAASSQTPTPDTHAGTEPIHATDEL